MSTAAKKIGPASEPLRDVPFTVARMVRAVAASAPPVDPVRAAAERAPIVRTLTPEQRAELDEAIEELRSGRIQGIPHAEVRRALTLLP